MGLLFFFKKKKKTPFYTPPVQIEGGIGAVEACAVCEMLFLTFLLSLCSLACSNCVFFDAPLTGEYEGYVHATFGLQTYAK
jgi:hypothetical protein